MKTQNALIKPLAIAMALAALFVATPLRAAPAPHLRQTPSVGVTFGQTLRLNLLNLGEDRGIVINWSFIDGDGVLVAASERAVEVAPGKVVSIDLNRDALTRAGNRVQLRAVAQASDDLNIKTLLVTLEVFDNATGKTTAGPIPENQ